MLIQSPQQLPDYAPSVAPDADIANYKDNFSSMTSPIARDGDVEAQRHDRPQQIAPAGDTSGVEYTVPTHKKLIALSFYFFLSLGLTIQSKMLLGKVKYPIRVVLRPD